MDPLEVRRNRPAQSNTETPLRETASQTAGPYVHIGCKPVASGIENIYPNDLTSNRKPLSDKTQTRKITISGHVYDGDGALAKDVMIEAWQADHTGNYANGIWNRAATNLSSGEYAFSTIMPGSFKDANSETLAPFINIWITARGINIGLHTRIYFPEFAEMNAQDPHLALISPSRIKTVLATTTHTADSYKFDIYLQGDHETVFIDT